jgi:hypothetical protein
MIADVENEAVERADRGGNDHLAILRQIQRAGLPFQDLDRLLGGNFKALAAA